MNQRSFTFQGQLRMSEGVDDRKDIKAIILSCFPTAVQVERADRQEDRHGTDYWVTTQSGHKHSVDVKVRDVDWRVKHPGEDDLALETWSVVDKKKGWTRDEQKRTDYILWIWKDTGRWVLIPFPMLCGVFEKNWKAWREKYRTRKQRTIDPRGGWESECVFVPRKIIWNAIYTTFGGGAYGTAQTTNKTA